MDLILSEQTLLIALDDDTVIRDSVRAMQAAVMTAVIVPATITTS